MEFTSALEFKISSQHSFLQKETIQLTKDIIPDTASYGVKISGDSMEPEFEDGQIAWVLKQDTVENGEYLQ